MPKVSVIIPVYNVEKYLRQCLDSVVGQTLEDIEIICVDDGSTDSSPEILAEYAANDPRIKVISQQNQHAGIARNNGIDAATGDYLAFLDSDDYFKPNALELLYESSIAGDADVCVCAANRFYEEQDVELPTTSYLHKKYLPETEPFAGADIMPYILNFTNMCVWNKLFKRTFVESAQLRFSDKLVGEDRVFVAPALCLAERMTTVEKALVTHRVGRESNLTGEGSVKPMEAYQGWLDLKKELIARDMLPEDSFARKAVGAIAYNLQAISDWDIFSQAVKSLQDGIADELGIVERDDDDFYLADWQNDFARHLHADSPEQLVLYLLNLSQNRLRYSGSRATKARARSKSLESKNTRLTEKNERLVEKNGRLSEKNESLVEKNAQLAEKNVRLSEKSEQLREQNKTQASQIKRLRVAIGKRDFKIEEIRHSRTYRLGRAVTFPARFARKLVRRIRH